MKRSLLLSTQSQAKQCRIELEPGLLDKLATFLPTGVSSIAIICDSTVKALYGTKLRADLEANGHKTYLFDFPAGEAAKTRQTASHLQDQLLAQGLDRDALVIALGGGVSTDLGGYVAASYLRGIALINIPTSLLAMVDASIGGKTGVNTEEGKNLIGFFWQPEAILIDPTVLQTLPESELREGCSEMLKHGVIADAEYFEQLVHAADQIFARDMKTLQKLIAGSCAIKSAVVEADVSERAGKRRILNFGHTVGHAIELCSEYQISHGQAVAVGMLAESVLSHLCGLAPSELAATIRSGLLAFGFNLDLPKTITIDALLSAMSADKKRADDQIRFVLPDQLGSCAEFNGAYCLPCAPDLVSEALERCFR